MKRQKMRTEQKSNVKNSVGRLVFVGLSLLLQVLWILLLDYSDSGVSGAGALHISGVWTQECGRKGDAQTL